MFVPASPPGKTGVTFKPARMVESFGNNLMPETVGANVNQFGPVAFVIEAILLAPVWLDEALSFCSQQ